jgi:hypothetical protein
MEKLVHLSEIFKTMFYFKFFLFMKVPFGSKFEWIGIYLNSLNFVWTERMAKPQGTVTGTHAWASLGSCSWRSPSFRCPPHGTPIGAPLSFPPHRRPPLKRALPHPTLLFVFPPHSLPHTATRAPPLSFPYLSSTVSHQKAAASAPHFTKDAATIADLGELHPLELLFVNWPPSSSFSFSLRFCRLSPTTAEHRATVVDDRTPSFPHHQTTSSSTRVSGASPSASPPPACSPDSPHPLLQDRTLGQADFSDKLADFSDKSAILPKIDVVISRRIFPETRRFLPKIDKWNEKTVKNREKQWHDIY